MYADLNIDMEAGRTAVNDTDQSEITIPVSYLEPLGLGSDAKAALGKSITLGVTDATGKQGELSGSLVGVQQASLVGSITPYVNRAFADAIYTTVQVGTPSGVPLQSAAFVAIMKDGLTAFQIFNAFPGIGCSFITIVGADSIFTKIFF